MRVQPPWHELVDLIEGARARGFTEAQVDYLSSVVGVTYAKGFIAGERSQ